MSFRLYSSALVLVAGTAMAQQVSSSSPNLIKFQQGLDAYKAAQFRDAASAFESVIETDPGNASAHLLRGAAWEREAERAPGGSPQQTEAFRAAESEYQRVLELDSKSLAALDCLADLTYARATGTRDAVAKLADLERASHYYGLLANVYDTLDPSGFSRTFLYGRLAQIAIFVAGPQREVARRASGMAPNDPGPIRDLPARDQFQTCCHRVVNGGLAAAGKTLEIDPKYYDAPRLIGVLLTLRADLRDTLEAYEADQRSAADWMARTPPPPLPPNLATIKADSTRRINVNRPLSEAQLLYHPQPAYPPLAKQARVQGVVLYHVLINRNGTVESMELKSGHPLLVEAAGEALKNWIWRPLMVGSSTVAIDLDVSLRFGLSN